MIDLLAAAGSAAAQPPVWLQILPWVAIFAVFWFLMIRPQLRQQKAHQEKVAGLQRGDEVVTLYGMDPAEPVMGVYLPGTRPIRLRSSSVSPSGPARARQR